MGEFFENGRENPSGSVCLDPKGRYRKLKTVSKLNMLSGDLCAPPPPRRAAQG